jgi:hypothetical protein
VAGYPLTPRVGKLAVEEAVERPYQQTVDHLAGSHGIRLGKELVENVVETVGQWWLEQDRQDYQSARDHCVCPASEQHAERCLVFADGVMVHSDGAWRETRVGTVRSEGAGGLTFKSSIALMSDTEQFGQQLWRNACRLGLRGASVTAFIADGSHWLWNLADRHFGRAVKIVDFWHVCEHVSKCSRAFFGEGSDEGRCWSLAVCGTLRAGRVDDALAQVEQLHPRSSKLRREEKHELVTYLRNNRDRMDYPLYEAMGLPIGSGEVEAQCKTLVQQRCKQAGMRWQRSGLESLLRVRCAVRDGRYDRDFGRWRGNLTAWHMASKRRRAQAA